MICKLIFIVLFLSKNFVNSEAFLKNSTVKRLEDLTKNWFDTDDFYFGMGGHRKVEPIIEPVEIEVMHHMNNYKNYYPPIMKKNVWSNQLNKSVTTMKPIDIDCSLNIFSFGDISISTMDYKITLYMRLKWRDPRLKHTYNRDQFPVSMLFEKFWIPDIYFWNAKHVRIHKLMHPHFLVWLDRNGTMLFSQKLTVISSCPINLWNFPMDDPVCNLTLGSYSYTQNEINFRWSIDREIPVELDPHIQLNEYKIPNIRLASYSHFYSKMPNPMTRLQVTFNLKRKLGFYLIYTYFPSILIVLIGWISFLIDYRSAPARVTISLCSTLSLVTQSATTLRQVPRVSYLKAIDIWIFVCLAFVVFTLFEFAIVNSISKSAGRSSLKNMFKTFSVKQMQQFFKKEAEGVDETLTAGNQAKVAQKIANFESTVQFFYLILFICFCLFYWSYYNH